MKSLRCPFCHSICALGTGYYHDEKLNIHCKSCHKIILATNEEDEEELHKLHNRSAYDYNEYVAPPITGGSQRKHYSHPYLANEHIATTTCHFHGKQRCIRKHAPATGYE